MSHLLASHLRGRGSGSLPPGEARRGRRPRRAPARAAPGAAPRTPCRRAPPAFRRHCGTRRVTRTNARARASQAKPARRTSRGGVPRRAPRVSPPPSAAAGLRRDLHPPRLLFWRFAFLPRLPPRRRSSPSRLSSAPSSEESPSARPRAARRARRGPSPSPPSRRGAGSRAGRRFSAHPTPRGSARTSPARPACRRPARRFPSEASPRPTLSPPHLPGPPLPPRDPRPPRVPSSPRRGPPRPPRSPRRRNPERSGACVGASPSPSPRRERRGRKRPRVSRGSARRRLSAHPATRVAGCAKATTAFVILRETVTASRVD